MQRLTVVSIAHIGQTTIYTPVLSVYTETWDVIVDASFSRGEHGRELRIWFKDGSSFSLECPVRPEVPWFSPYELWVYRDETWHIWGKFPLRPLQEKTEKME